MTNGKSLDKNNGNNKNNGQYRYRFSAIMPLLERKSIFITWLQSEIMTKYPACLRSNILAYKTEKQLPAKQNNFPSKQQLH